MGYVQIVYSHDVVSLLTNTPIDKCLDIIKERSHNDNTLKDCTKLNSDDIIELLKFVITTAYFSFRGQIYQQIFGAAMGSPVSAIVANFFMEWLEEEAIATAPMDIKPKLRRCYVDDVIEIIKEGTTEKLTQHRNTIDPTGSTKVTYEEESDRKISFWDTLLVRKEDGSVGLPQKDPHKSIFELSVTTSTSSKTWCHQNTNGQNGKHCNRGGG